MAASHLTVCQLVHDQDGKAVFLAPFNVALRPQRPYRFFTSTETVQILYVHRDRTDSLRPQRPYRFFTSTETVQTVMDGQVFLGFFAGS